jgi:hypothetical protein
MIIVLAYEKMYSAFVDTVRKQINETSFWGGEPFLPLKRKMRR